MGGRRLYAAMNTFLMDHDAIRGDLATFPPAEALHARRVLRLRAGDEVRITDGGGRMWLARLESCGPEAVTARLVRALSANEPPVRLTLYQGLPKADKLDWIVQKGTELGAAAFCPLAMARSVARIEDKDRTRRQERLARIAREAAKQCGRGSVPAVERTMDFSAALPRMRAHDLLLMPWEEAGDCRLADAFRDAPGARDIGILIGPEGGITAQEAQASGAVAVTLGPRILRTETAALAALAMVGQLWGDL